MELNGKGKIKKLSLQFETPKESQGKIWRELKQGHGEFQKILRILVKHEKQKLKDENSLLNWLFYMREALCACDPKQLRLFLCNLGGYLFHIVAEAEGASGHLVTSWLHEDGIQAERDLNLLDKTHPVHHLVCMTDFYYESSRDIDLENSERAPSKAALNLMLRE